MQKSLTGVLLTVLAFLVAAGDLAADQVTMADGSVLNGRIRSMANGSLILETNFSDPVSIKVWEIRSVSTDEPVQVVLADGTEHRGTLESGSGGAIVLHPVGGGDDVTFSWATAVAIYRFPSRWSARLTLGGSFSEGNAEVLGFSASGSASTTSEQNRLTSSGKFTIAEANGTEVARSGKLSLQYDRFFQPRWYLHVTEELHHDHFADELLRSVSSVGLGHVLVQGPGRILEVEAGVGYMVERFSAEDDVERLSARGAAHLQLPFGTRALLTDDFAIYPSLEDSEVKLHNDLTLGLKLTGDWGLQLEVDLLWDSDPSTVAEATDVKTTLGVSYSF